MYAKNLLEDQIYFPLIIQCAMYEVSMWYIKTAIFNTQCALILDVIEDNILKMLFTPTLKNAADIFTKNTTKESFQLGDIKLVKPIHSKKECVCFIALLLDKTMRT
jgi:hypothetical protein